MPDDTIPLKRFFETVERRLSACSADELRSILRAMAQAVAPRDRREFLEALVPGKENRDVLETALQQDDLLSEIDDLIAEIRAEMDGAEPSYDQYGDYWDDEDSLGPYEQFVAPLSELFDRTAGVFDCGNRPLARDAYRKLFDGLALEDEYGRGVRATDLHDADVRGARGRYLRAVYETTAPADRPERLFEEMQNFGDHLWDGPIALDDLIRVSDRPLPEREAFLRAWIAFLRGQEGRSADRWLREAIRLLDGAKGLEAFARKEGKAHPRAYLDWVAALQDEGKPARVVAAAREALRSLPADQPIRAAVADHLCEAARARGDAETVLEARWEAFLAEPKIGRLLDLWEATPEAQRRTRMRQAARRLEQALERQTRREARAFDAAGDDGLESPVWVGRALLAHARLLSGDWDAARALAAEAGVLGWSTWDNPQGVVVPACLLLLSGRVNAPPANVARLWDRAVENSMFLSEFGKQNEDQKRLRSIYQDEMSRTRLKKAQAGALLSWCVEVGERRACAIVEKLRRKSYDQAAVVTAACAEVLRLRDQPEAAAGLLERMRTRFPRHRAFQDELKSAAAKVGRDTH
jgi:hypothetical protein